MANHYDDAIEIAQSNESGAARCVLAPSVELLISDRGEVFTVWDYRRGREKRVSAEWSYRFLGRALGVRVESFEW